MENGTFGPFFIIFSKNLHFKGVTKALVYSKGLRLTKIHQSARDQIFSNAFSHYLN